jgi:ABC-type phosphate transport system auxiliary subunit
MAENPITTEKNSGTMFYDAAKEELRRQVLEAIRGELLQEANELQEKAKSLRTKAHRIHLLINSDTGRISQDKAPR